MSNSFVLSSKWIQNKIFWLLLLIPISFKIEVFPKIIVLPQEIILPFFILLYLFSKRKFNFQISQQLLPYIYLLLTLTITALLTIPSFFQALDFVGFLKLFKYSIYVISIVIISDYQISRFIKKINIIAIISILLTLLLFYLNKINSGHSWKVYTDIATYNSYYMPTGFSNRIYNLESNSFIIYSGNHGIYGSYLVLMLFVNISAIIKGTVFKKISYAVIILSFVNIMLLTSRETFLLLFVLLFSFGLYRISSYKFKLSTILKSLIFLIGFVFILISVINIFEMELSIVNKISNSIQGFKEKGGDGSINVRFNTWSLIIIYLFTHPWRLIFGTGFNPTLFREKIDAVANLHPEIGQYVGIPESLFFGFLSYGGILALIFILLFLYSLFKNVIKRQNTVLGRFIPFYILGIIVTNNTGASIIAELVMTQLALIYFYIMNSNEDKKNT